MKQLLFGIIEGRMLTDDDDDDVNEILHFISKIQTLLYYFMAEFSLTFLKLALAKKFELVVGSL